MEEHGDYWLQFSDNVIYLRIKGAWNLETFTHYNTEVNKYFSDNQSSNISALVVMEGESLMVPEVNEKYRSAINSRISQGLKNVAFNIGQSDCPSTLKLQVEKLYKGLEINYRFFDSLPLAMGWLNTLGVKINHDKVSTLFN